jgi:hypothetical protein
MPIDEPIVAATEPTAETETPETDDRSALQKVEALLAGPPSAEAEKPQDDSKTSENWDVSRLAEKLQATPDNLYEALYSVKVPIADGETRTLGELKDGYKTAKALETEREQFHVERTAYQTDQRQTQAELQQVLQALPPQTLTPQLIEQARAQLAEKATRDRAQLLELVPEWRDDLKRAADQAVIEEYVAGFGFTKQDLAGVSEAKLHKLLRSAALQDKALKVARTAPPKKVAQAPRPGKAQSPAMEHGRLKAAVTMRRMAPLAAVEQLLKGR